MTDLVIGVFGGAALFLAMDSRASVRRWGPVLGLISQPFWYWTTFENSQWGILALCPFYTAAWVKGFRREWKLSAGPVMNYEAWRISFQSAEHAARTAHQQVEDLGRELTAARVTVRRLETELHNERCADSELIFCSCDRQHGVYEVGGCCNSCGGAVEGGVVLSGGG